MLKKIQQDFSYYSHEFKDNYRKGVHRLRTILASRAQAQAFVSNAGGTAVVLGYEPSAPDKNAQELYALLAASPYIDDAVQTFLGSIYEAGAESQDAMYSDSARCLEILHDPVMARAAGAGAVSAGKWIATLAGQSCNLYRDMNAVAASDIAMTAVAASETAMAAVVSNATALNAVVTSHVALNAVAASETAMAAVIGNATALNVVATSQAAMNAVAASETAMTALIANTAAFNTVVTSHVAMNAVASSYVAVAAVYESAVAVEAVKANETAWATLTGASSAVMGKAAAKLAGLNPADYADMTAIASSSTAMAAVINNSTALNAVVSSSTAMAAIIANSTALNAVVSSSAAMSAVAASQTAMAAVAASQTAMAAVASSQTAMAAVAASYVAVAAVYGSAVAVDAVKANETAWATLAGATSAVMGKAVAVLSGLNPDSYADMTAVASSSTAMTAVCSSALAFNAALKNSTARTQLAGSSYLQSNYDKLLSTVGNSTYFSQKFDNIDSGAKRAISGGNTDTTATANESVFLCKKIGAWSNGNSVTGTVAHLQTKTTAGSISTRAGGGQSTDDYTTGGVQAKYICIGGCTFTENGDAYCCGIFAFAK